MTFVTKQQLENLRCLKCQKYLSHFPIHQSTDQRGCICGRCSMEGNTIRNTVYEKLALQLQFPCSYDENGCLETLYPEQIPLHEKFCKFRPYDCPANSSANCKWKGLMKDIWDHFNQRHIAHAIKDNRFEVDFVASYNENYLLNVDEELYVVNQDNSKNHKFSCNVFYIGSNIHAQNYLYKLSFQDNSNHSYTVSKKLEEETVVEREFIMKTFEDPSVVMAQIQVVKPDNNSEEHYAKVEWELLRELECICCLEYMLPPVQQCVTGHSICSKCKPTQSICPSCRAEFKDTINLTLGNLIEHIVYPCKNNKEGCKFTSKAKYIREHEMSCTFGKFKCPLNDYENCEEEMSYMKLHDHLLNKHSENLLELDTISMPFKRYYGNETNENIKEDCLILKYDFHLFKLHYKYENDTFLWAMQLIGTSAEDEKYDFEINATDFASKQRVTFKKECGVLTDKVEAFGVDKPFISINLKQIGYMIFDDFTYSVRIVPRW